jgi:Zn-dependent M28 family amino/carboxypeptidase
MINMDMIGRMRERSLMVGGVASGDGLREIVETAARDFPFELQMSGQAVYGSSDHTAFTSHEIPVLFFFTGLHPDYHRPTDTVDKIDGRNTALIADLAGSVVRSLAQSASRPAFHYMNGKKGCTAGTLPHTRDESDR